MVNINTLGGLNLLFAIYIVTILLNNCGIECNPVLTVIAMTTVL